MRAVAGVVLSVISESELPPRLRGALEHPTPSSLNELAEHLIGVGNVDAALRLFDRFAPLPGFSNWALTGLARLREKRGDASGAADAWRMCIAQNPTGALADWFVSLARVERRCGRLSEAEATLRACLHLHANHSAALVSLADLLAARGRLDEAAPIWREVLARPSIESEPWWFVACAAVLRAQGRREAEQQILEQLVARFPQSIAALETLARRAAMREAWEEALAAWDRCRHANPDREDPAWLNGRAAALTRLWRLEEAVAIDEQLMRRFPDYGPGLINATARAMEFGRNEGAYAWLRSAIARQPNLAEPELWERLARCAISLKRFEEADSVISELRTKFPESPLGPRAAVLRARALRTPFVRQAASLREALEAFPADREMLALKVQFMLAAGDRSAAETAARALREGGDDHLTLIARWRLELERRGETALREWVEVNCAGREWTLISAEAVALFLLELWSAWATERALDVVSEIDRRHPRRPHIVALRARALIALERDQEALATVDSLPSLCVTPAALELRAWAAARRGRHELAKRLWRDALARRYFAEVDAIIRDWKPVGRQSLRSQESRVTAFMVVRDEMHQLADFLAHHRRLGVGRFVVVDNMSNDGGFEFLAGQEDVALYRTSDDFGESGTGMRWINELMQRYDDGRWRLFLDADERFVFSGCETLSIDNLVDELEGEGAEAMSALLLDMFPKRLFDPSGHAAPSSKHAWFDSDYVWRGEIRAPYKRPMGGARARLFGSQEYLQKVPLTRAGCATYVSNHEVTHARLATTSAALLHFKLYSLACSAAAREPQAGKTRADGNFEVMRRYVRYGALKETIGAATLTKRNVSRRLTDSSQLRELGLLGAGSNRSDRKSDSAPYGGSEGRADNADL